VQPIGKLNRKGSLGSPYSVSDYRAINPEYGTAADFKAFVDDAHAQGIKVLLDWVANHTAFDTRDQGASRVVHAPQGWLDLLPLDDKGKETDWTDVAELNYDNKDMRKAMIADMRYWLDSMNVDGYRCDVAWGVPEDFWNDARTELEKVKPDLFWLAEGEGPEFHPNFDMTYGWEFHHLLNEIAQRRSQPARSIPTSRTGQDVSPTAFRLYFTTESRREQLERLGVRAHGRESSRGVHPERHAASINAAAVHRPGGEHEEAPSFDRHVIPTVPSTGASSCSPPGRCTAAALIDASVALRNVRAR